MAMMDQDTLLAEDKALPSSATTEYSDDEIDFEAGVDAWGTAMANPYAGRGTPLYLNIVMTEAGVSAGGGTVEFNIVHAATTAPTTKLLQICTAVAAATLVAGYKFSVAIPQYPRTLRYLRLQCITSTDGYSAGKYTAWVSPDPLADI